MVTLSRLVNGKETGWSKEYTTAEGAYNASISWMRDFTIHAEIRKTFSVEITKQEFYILKTSTDQSWDEMEQKFYNSNWEPQTTDDKRSLEIAIEENTELFAGCRIEERTIDITSNFQF